MKRFLICLILCVCSAVCAVALSTEKIEQFSSFAVVKEDSSVEVTETIIVRADGDKIRRGIFRTLPYKGVSDYEIVSVLRDGKAEPYTVKKSSSDKTVYIGDSGRILPPGRYVYELSYTVKGAVRFQKDFDEFYWNVTGNDWQFPIQAASFRLSLLQGAEVVPGGVSFYTGIAGAKGQNARQLQELFFETTRPLSAYEGFTVSVAWNKGIVKEPSFVERIFSGLAVWFLIAWVLLVIYYIFVWRWVGKDPKARVLRRFTPPEGLSPAQVRYLRLMGWNKQMLSVILISLSLKGYVKVKKVNGLFELSLLTPPADVPLSPEELACKEVLFKRGDWLSVSNAFVENFQGANSAGKNALKKWAGKRFFSRNAWCNFPSYLFGAAWFIFLAYQVPADFSMVQWGVAVAILILALRSFFEYWFPRTADKIPFFWLVFLIEIFILCGVKWGALSACVFAPGVIFSYLVRAYTLLGRQKMDEIEGFKEYLEVAEINRVFASNPTDAARIYCDYLPYAVALDVQNKWWTALEHALGAAAASQELESQGYSVVAAGELSALASAISLASVPPSSDSSSSDSGFGGGGCSGGGSGGGGGGGW